NLSSDKSSQSIYDKKPRPKPGLVWSEEARCWLRGSPRPALYKRDQLCSWLNYATRVQTIWNLRDAATANFRHYLSCIISPNTAHTIKATRIVAARYSAIVMIAPGLIPMSEILLAIAPIPRREPGNFSTLTRNFLDRPRCRGTSDGKAAGHGS